MTLWDRIYAHLADCGPFSAGWIDAPEVTIILTTFDRPRRLREALASLSAQRKVQFEVIVINDAGCDVSSLTDFKWDSECAVYQP